MKIRLLPRGLIGLIGLFFIAMTFYAIYHIVSESGDQQVPSLKVPPRVGNALLCHIPSEAEAPEASPVADSAAPQEPGNAISSTAPAQSQPGTPSSAVPASQPSGVASLGTSPSYVPSGYTPPRTYGYSSGGTSSSGQHYVAGHMQNGKWVEGHYQTNPDGTAANNWSASGNTNPYTGTTGTSHASSSGGSVYVHGYTRKDGTYVSGHTRRK